MVLVLLLLCLVYFKEELVNCYGPGYYFSNMAIYVWWHFPKYVLFYFIYNHLKISKISFPSYLFLLSLEWVLEELSDN